MLKIGVIPLTEIVVGEHRNGLYSLYPMIMGNRIYARGSAKHRLEPVCGKRSVEVLMAHANNL